VVFLLCLITTQLYNPITINDLYMNCADKELVTCRLLIRGSKVRVLEGEQKADTELYPSFFLKPIKMSHYIYILYSNKIDKYYVGYSQDPEKRLAFHNSEYNKIWSKRGRPWESKVVIEFSDKKAALQAEKFVKNLLITLKR